MIVCPDCRNVNDEDAIACTRCGRSLEPGATALAPRRPPSERPPLDIAPPRPPSPWRAIVVLGALVVAGVGSVAWYVLRPDPCQGTNFTSSQFGYCLSVPEDWEWQPARFGDAVTVDQFSVPSEAATVLVEAADLPDDADLQSFAASVRQKDEDAGMTPGPVEEASLDGTDALAWDIDYTSASGRAFGVREIVVVRDHFGWRLMLNDTASEFDRHVPQFTQMVRSFRFR